jgi:hypothetical protein
MTCPTHLHNPLKAFKCHRPEGELEGKGGPARVDGLPMLSHDREFVGIHEGFISVKAEGEG